MRIRELLMYSVKQIRQLPVTLSRLPTLHLTLPLIRILLRLLRLLFLMVVFLFEIGAGGRDEFSKLLPFAVGILVGLQSFINIGIAIGILPVTGLTLPFISYGGSSTLMFWMALGLAINVAIRK